PSHALCSPASRWRRARRAPRARAGPGRPAAAPAGGAIVGAIERAQPIARMQPLAEWVARSLDTRRAPAALAGIFGMAATALSAVGLYGVLAFGVAQRTREFGIRQALGADPRALLGPVLAQGAPPAAFGLASGRAGAVVWPRWLRSLLFGVTPHDPAVFGGVTVVLFAIALIASYVPARRATRIDPAAALRG